MRFYLKLSALLFVAITLGVLSAQASAIQQLEQLSTHPPQCDIASAQREFNAAKARCWFLGPR